MFWPNSKTQTDLDMRGMFSSNNKFLLFAGTDVVHLQEAILKFHKGKKYIRLNHLMTASWKEIRHFDWLVVQLPKIKASAKIQVHCRNTVPIQYFPIPIFDSWLFL